MLFHYYPSLSPKLGLFPTFSETKMSSSFQKKTVFFLPCLHLKTSKTHFKFSSFFWTPKIRAVPASQGDRIGRIFASWVIVFFGQFFLEISEVAQLLELLFPRQKITSILSKKLGWAAPWAIFAQTLLVTLLPAMPTFST
jgi:hypothetical protein